MKAVFLDIDRTLAIGKDVPASAVESIHRLRDNGSQVWICTGRPFSYTYRYFSMYADGYIVSNGREGFYRDQPIFSRPLTQEQIKQIRERLDAVKAGYAIYSRDAGFYFGEEAGYQAISPGWDTGFLHRDTEIKEDVFNLDVWFADEVHFHAIESQLKDFAILNPHGTHPSADVTILGWDKGNGLKAVQEYLHISKEDTYAFGDGMNDVCMLKAAGHGIAMGNGQQALKDIAEYITTAIDEDGLKKGLLHYRLL